MASVTERFQVKNCAHVFQDTWATKHAKISTNAQNKPTNVIQAQRAITPMVAMIACVGKATLLTMIYGAAQVGAVRQIIVTFKNLHWFACTLHFFTLAKQLQVIKR